MRKRLKKGLRDRYGWLPLSELRNKAVLGYSAVGLRQFEDSEVRRLEPEVNARFGGSPPSASVATVLLTYKRPDGLRAALRSALDQSVRDHVVLVVDDGGGLTGDLPDDPRVCAVSLSRNINVLGVQRNIGMRLTRSTYLAFLDDDNLWLPNHLEVAIGALESGDPKPDAVYTAMLRVTPDGSLYDTLSVPFDRKAASNATFLDSNPLVVRRSPGLRYSRIRRGRAVAPKEDWEFIYRLSRDHRVEHVPVTTVQYLINPDSHWTTWAEPPSGSGPAGDATAGPVAS